jgi:uncharacterized protein
MSPSDTATTLERELAPHIGPLGPWRWSRTEINHAEIWNFCEAVRDENPVYWDDNFAAASRFGRLIAPPQALLAFTHPRPWRPEYLPPPTEPGVPDPEDEIRTILARHGYATATAVSREEEYLEPFGPGDGRIGKAVRCVGVSPVKKTKVGRGVFVTTVAEFRVEAHERRVARATTVILRYAAAGPPEQPR